MMPLGPKYRTVSAVGGEELDAVLNRLPPHAVVMQVISIGRFEEEDHLDDGKPIYTIAYREGRPPRGRRP